MQARTLWHLLVSSSHFQVSALIASARPGSFEAPLLARSRA